MPGYRQDSNPLNAANREDLLRLMEVCFTHDVAEHFETDYPVTGQAFDSLSVQEVGEIEARVQSAWGDQLGHWKRHDFPHFRREVLRYGCTVLPDVLLQRTGMTPHNPPQEIHSMMRSDVFAGDLYSGDMIAAAVRRAGHGFRPEGHYLDFGCSSGALVRNLAAAHPRSRWSACDPVPEPVTWASDCFPAIDFFVNEQQPPLPLDDASLQGCYAVSIWSHFSERAALHWLEEMARVVAPGGFLAFTTHGMRSIYSYLRDGSIPVALAAELLAGLLGEGFAFQVVWDADNPDRALDVSDWGNAYFLPAWLARQDTPWRPADFRPGLNQSNQDVYVLTRA